MNLSFLVSQLAKKVSATLSSDALAFAALFISEFSGQWAGTNSITTWDTDTLVTTTAQLNTAISTAVANPGLKTRIRVSSGFTNAASTIVQFNGTATQGNFIASGGALLICPDTTEVNITSQMQINGIRGAHIKGLMFARTATDAALNKNWVPSDGGVDPQDTNAFIVQRNSTRPLWSILRFDNCKFGAGNTTTDPLEWMTICSFAQFEEIICKNCIWKGGKTLIKLTNYRRFRNINPDFQLAIRDICAATMVDSTITAGTITGTITAGTNTIESPTGLSLATYPSGIAIGMYLNGTGIPALAKITGFTGPATAPTQITMSGNATASSTLSINIQDNVRSRYSNDNYCYTWESGGTRRNYLDAANQLSGDGRNKLYYDAHSDGIQLGSPTDAVNYRCICENMVMYAERVTYFDDTSVTWRKDAGAQGFYMDDSTLSIDCLYVNTLIANGAQWNHTCWNGATLAEFCTAVRAGALAPSAKVANGDAFNYTVDPKPAFGGKKLAGTAIPTSYKVSNSIGAFVSISGSGYEAVPIIQTNIAVSDPTIGVANYGTAFNGAFSVDSEGRNIYTFSSDTGGESQAAFRAALYAQFTPKGSFIGKGVRDPAGWTESNFY